MLFKGTNIRNTAPDPLREISFGELCESIRFPDQATSRVLRRMNKVRDIDQRTFHALKTALPYFIGATFRQGMRKTENFIEINWMVLDMDGCVQTIDDEERIKAQFREDKRVALAFVSPSETGMKALFRFRQPVKNTKQYADLYHTFARQFSVEHKLEKFMDFKTHDVTRICFMSSDPMPVIHEEYQSIDPGEYQLPVYESAESPKKDQEETDEKPKALEESVYKDILKKLNPKARPGKKNYFVPEVLEKIVDPIKQEANIHGIEVTEVRDIHYGKKFCFSMGEGKAELNVYFGKNGFSVVKTPKKGTIEEFNEVVSRLANQVIYNLQNHKRIREITEKHPDYLKNLN